MGALGYSAGIPRIEFKALVAMLAAADGFHWPVLLVLVMVNIGGIKAGYYPIRNKKVKNSKIIVDAGMTR
jgi:hypothetical protein